MAKKEPEEAGAATEADKTEKIQFITVQSAKPDSDRVAFHEQHKHHPDGDAFVYGKNEVKVAKTSEVIRALNENRIVEV